MFRSMVVLKTTRYNFRLLKFFVKHYTKNVSPSGNHGISANFHTFVEFRANLSTPMRPSSNALLLPCRQRP